MIGRKLSRKTARKLPLGKHTERIKPGKPRVLSNAEARMLFRKNISELSDSKVIALDWAMRGLSRKEIQEEIKWFTQFEGKPEYSIWAGRARLEIAKAQLSKHAEMFFGKFSPKSPEGLLIAGCLEPQMPPDYAGFVLPDCLAKGLTVQKALQIARTLKHFVEELKKPEFAKRYSPWLNMPQWGSVENGILKRVEVLEKTLQEFSNG